MRFYVTNPFRLLFPHALWSTSSRDLHLTFDDGPHPSATPQILDILERFNARATFFMLGSHIKKYPALAKEAAARGGSFHEVISSCSQTPVPSLSGRSPGRITPILITQTLKTHYGKIWAKDTTDQRPWRGFFA